MEYTHYAEMRDTDYVLSSGTLTPASNVAVFWKKRDGL